MQTGGADRDTESHQADFCRDRSLQKAVLAFGAAIFLHNSVRSETQRTKRRRPRDARGMDCLYITRYLYSDLRPNFGLHTTGSVPLSVTGSDLPGLFTNRIGELSDWG